MLYWLRRFNTFCFLDSHGYQIEPFSEACLVAAGVKTEYVSNSLEQLAAYLGNQSRWIFGHLAYDIKNQLEDLHSNHPDKIEFPDLYFFEPEILIRLNEDYIEIEAEVPEKVYAEIFKAEQKSIVTPHIEVTARFTKNEYEAVIKKLKDHIHRGDCYEINFCVEFFATDAVIDPIDTYQQLATVSPNPLSALYRMNDRWLLCASPERFLKKQGDRIISQPIKGTSKRTAIKRDDDIARKQLFESAKDRAENVMVVDLVRNDLSKICKEGTVVVDELYGIYSFPQVHQMISTISGQLKDKVTFIEVMQACFPMGSMTGAPKLKVMQLIEEYETARRGIFAGAVGYFDPEGDYDFNVVIRSIMYNSANKYLSFKVGSGITSYSDPSNEWEECMMKAEAIMEVLS